MGVPSYWSSSYRYSTLACVDVDDIVTRFRLDTVTNGSPQWTEPNANEFHSPIDADGRGMILTFTRASATVLQMNVKDQSNNNICTRQMYISSTQATYVDVYSGQFHAMIAVLYEFTTTEFLYAGILDLTPLSQTAMIQYVFGHGSRTSLGALSNQYWYYSTTYDGQTIVRFENINFVVALPTGAIPAAPILAVHRALDLNYYFSGHLYQAVQVPNSLGYGVQFQTPIAPGILGTFRVAYALFTGNTTKIAMRIA